MRVFLTTVAGLSSRFSDSLGQEAIKCIYYEADPKKTLLFNQLQIAKEYDRLVIVGGYRFTELCRYLEHNIDSSIKQKILLVHNEDYARYGSGWSFLKGIRAVQMFAPEEILFAEGDLAFGRGDFQKIAEAKGDVITFTLGPINASTSVAAYLSADGRPHFLYDVQHGLIQVEEPFISIFNSGQVWKFADPALLYSLADELPESLHQRTNLEIINAYFSKSNKDALSLINFAEWVNCNTISEFKTVKWEEQYGD